MQRRTIQRSSSAKNRSSLLPFSSSRIADGSDGKIKGRKFRPHSLVYAIVLTVFAVYGIGMVLSPSQKKELVQAEHEMEDWFENRQHPAPPSNQDERRATPKQSDKAKTKNTKDPPKQEEKQQHEQQNVDPSPPKENINDNTNRDSSDVATTRMNAQSSRWVDGEKALKKKLQVLYDIQAKGDHLAVPVLTRYLGEDIPAFVGTPDSTMNEEEWKKLVDAKYEEMRLEELEWQKKMSLLMGKQGHDMGITTA